MTSKNVEGKSSILSNSCTQPLGIKIKLHRIVSCEVECFFSCVKHGQFLYDRNNENHGQTIFIICVCVCLCTRKYVKKYTVIFACSNERIRKKKQRILSVIFFSSSITCFSLLSSLRHYKQHQSCNACKMCHTEL